MAILHGSWVVEPTGGFLFIWAEVWRRVGPLEANQAQPLVYPFAMSPTELLDFCQSLHQTAALKWQGFPKPETKTKKAKSKQVLETTKWQTLEVALPTALLSSGQVLAQPSASLPEKEEMQIFLHPWQIEGMRLNAGEAIEFLQGLPLGNLGEELFFGGNLRFWSYVNRWGLDLRARGKFLPALQKQENSYLAVWQPLLDSGIDRERLQKFSKQMPLSCRTYQNNSAENLAINLPTPPKDLLLDFISATLDAQIRSISESLNAPALPVPMREFLAGLGAKTGQMAANLKGIESLETSLKNWTAPIDYELAKQREFRACFSLQPPENGKGNWRLNYGLQAADDPGFVVDAKIIWSRPVERLIYGGRSIEQPQETLLKGLGLASRLNAAIEPSLNEASPVFCPLTPLQAYEFLKAGAWRFEDSGLGVILPGSLANREGWANRLGLSIKAETPKLKKHEQIGLQSLLNFKWELTIGGQKISKAEFDRLVRLNSPLVEINGEWVELRPSDVKAAEVFFAGRKDQMAVSLQDALRLATGDSQTIEKLPVVNFEAAGALQDLFTNLTTNRGVEAIETPENFKGELREYQARGAGWLAFLEKWGLGACLADDMGLGKCTTGDSNVFVNGKLEKAAEIWVNYAGETEFDGEGFWAKPTQELLVNSIDENTGKIVQASVRRLYRQQVRETLRKVTLKDGSCLTITRRHKLLTRDGWSNDFKVGDYICVPAKLLWDGKGEDPDLVQFLAWQISEGYENNKSGTLGISQNDKFRLEELRQILHRIGVRYGLKINSPSIQEFPGKVPVLRVNSQAYRQFLEAKGYQWGKRSREKVFPPFIMQSDNDNVRLFLRHYFDAEGSVSTNMRSVEISTASPQIIEQISTLLRRFGIWLRVTAKQKRATNGSGIFRTYYIGTLGGNSARRYAEEIGFSYPEKQRKLEVICEKVCNTNVEGIPASDIVAEAVNLTRLPVRHLGMHNTVYINGTQQFSRSSLERGMAEINRVLAGVSEQEYRLQKVSKWTTQTLEAYANLDTEFLTLIQQGLQSLLDLEVFYCQIESIEDIDYEGWVYDLEVNKHHNFVANNILCHNTIQTIAFFLHLQENEALEKPILLICPTSVLGNWEREVRKFGPTLKVMQYHGNNRPKGSAFSKAVKGKNLVITSYPLVQRDLKDLQSVKWQGIVLDEAQNIKNAESKQSQAVREIESDFRIALTGTPVENRLSELWSIMEFLNPGYLGAKNFFQRRFAIPIEKYGDSASLQTLRSLVQPFLLRRLKTDRDIIQDLPEKQENNIFCGLSEEQASLYQNSVEQSLAEIESAEGIQRRGMILGLLVKLKQICNHPILFTKTGTLNPQQSGKILRLQEMLEEVLAEKERALIFTQFAEWGKLLKPYLEKELGREVLFLYGSTSKQQREEMVDRFQQDPQGPPVMILSLKAGGTGLNLTRANHVFHFDRWWNPAVENQATDRVFRIGQTRNVQVHKFVCTGTLEEKIHDMIESKKALAEQVIGDGENWLTELDTDQLRNLLLLDRNAIIDEDK
ncbi:SNF2-related protein [Ancylothrix sp. C2]|nr:SNF2-related protein [Ancylothrix sp. D3o]MCT7952285.1 SNF2-related protein [Ancylothrix sp. D3o]